MKFLIGILAICLSLTAVNAAIFPPADVKVSVKLVAQGKIEVALTNLQKTNTTISIQSLDGKVVHFQELVQKHNGYRKRLNLNGLAAGKYLLTIETNTEKRQQVIVIDEQQNILLSIIK